MKISFNKTPESPDEIGGLKVNYAPAKRPFSKWRFNLVLLVFLLPFILYILYMVYNYVVVSEAGFVLLKVMTIKTPTDGVVKMLKPVGADVQKGEVVAILKNDFLEDKYKNYSAKLEHNNKDLKETIKNNRDMLQIAKDSYDSKNAEYKRLKKLRDKNLITEHVISNAIVQLKGALLTYTNAKENLENTKLALKETLVDELQVKELKAKLKSLVIISPSTGTVTLNSAKEGELVQEYDELLVIDLHSKPAMEVFLNPKNSRYADIGREVRVIFPDKTVINAIVSNVQMRAVKTPIELNSVLKKAPYSIVLELKLEEKIPKRFMINYLPIKVTFNTLF